VVGRFHGDVIDLVKLPTNAAMVAIPPDPIKATSAFSSLVLGPLDSRIRGLLATSILFDDGTLWLSSAGFLGHGCAGLVCPDGAARAAFKA